MEDLGQQCLVRYVDVQCKDSTAKRYRQLLRSHIVPALGEMPVGAVEREHIAALHHDLRDKRGQANNVLWVLSKMFPWLKPGGGVGRERTPAVRCDRTR